MPKRSFDKICRFKPYTAAMYSHIRVTLGLQTPFAKTLAQRNNKLFSNHGRLSMCHSYNIMVTEFEFVNTPGEDNIFISGIGEKKSNCTK
jgi:hypothetical protein